MPGSPLTARHLVYQIDFSEDTPVDEKPENAGKPRRKGRIRPLRPSWVLLLCVICAVAGVVVTLTSVYARFGGRAEYKSAIKYVEVEKAIADNYIGDYDSASLKNAAAAAMSAKRGGWPRTWPPWARWSANTRPAPRPSTAISARATASPQASPWASWWWRPRKKAARGCSRRRPPSRGRSCSPSPATRTRRTARAPTPS